MNPNELTNQISLMVNAYRASDDAMRLRLLLLDTIGVAVAGTNERISDAVRATVSHGLTGGESCTVIGGRQTDVVSASFANAVAAHVLDYDDTHDKSLVHVSTAVLPTLLAIGELSGRPFSALLEAYGLGTRMVGFFEKFGPALNRHGIHATSVLGAVSGATAGAWLISRSPSVSARAAQIAASSAMGLCENFGTDGKAIQVGVGATNATRSAMLAHNGVGIGNALFGKRGLLAVTLDADPIEACRWGDSCDDAVQGIAPKPYACCYLLHPVIDAALAMREELGGASLESVRNIRARVGPLAAMLANKRAIANNPLVCKFSASYCVASALTLGRLGVGDFAGHSGRDAGIFASHLKRITIEREAEFAPSQASLDIVLKSGAKVTKSITRTRVLSAQELQRKFRDNVTRVVDSDSRLLEDRIVKGASRQNVRQLLTGLDFNALARQPVGTHANE